MRIDENFDKLLKKACEFEKKEFPMGIGIIMQEGITNTLIKFGNEILEDCDCENKELRKQLEQAKKTIKGLLDLLHNEAYRTRCYEEMQKAEQFIKEK